MTTLLERIEIEKKEAVPPAKVAFILSKFPCYDEAFILREIDAIARKMEIVIFSLRSSKEKIVHDEARALLSKTLYVPYLFSWRIPVSFFRMLVRHPWRTLKALFRLIAGNFKNPEFLIKGLMFFPKSIWFADWAERNGVTHIHAYWATYPASVALVVSEITGIPFSFTGHAHDIYLKTTHLAEKMSHASFISTCTGQNKNYLKKVAPECDPEKIYVTYHGLALEKFQTAGKKRNETFSILSVGTLHYYKGFNYFLQALKILKDKKLDFRATIIGGGPLEEDLKEHIRLLGLNDRVTMTGPLKQAEVIPYYKKADVLVLMAQPEWHWGIPNVLIEALAARTAVITTRFGSVEELIEDQKTGILVGPKDDEGLANALEKLYSDDSLRLGLIDAGHAFVLERFDLEKTVRVLAGGFARKAAGG